MDLISRQAAIDIVTFECGKWTGLAKEISKQLKQLPSADLVPVVRCRDCKHWQTDWNPSIPDRHYCAVMDSMMKADDFCSYGEKREE